MSLHDQLHCPKCQSRLDPASPGELHCSTCGRIIAVVDGIADFVGEAVPPPHDPHRYGPHPALPEPPIGDLPARIRTAAGGRWPAYLGDVLELGCGTGQMTEALVSTEAMRGLLAIDTAIENVRACRERLGKTETPVTFATLSGSQNVIRDVVADTIPGVDVLARTGDVRGFLTNVHRALKPGGRAWFVVPNRRYHQALCQAVAEALVQAYARDRAWPKETHTAAELLASARLLQLHQHDPGFLAMLDRKHLFDSEMLEELSLEAGFATAEMIPLAPDPVGAGTVRLLWSSAGLSEQFAQRMAPLVSSAGQPYFSLLGRQDCSASMLLWLTKGDGPRVQVFAARPKQPPIGFEAAYSAMGGPDPRWSVELCARDTPGGIAVKVGGWCLVNTDVRWVKLSLGETTRQAPVWRPRPDVHEVLNGAGLFNPLNALCSGLDAELLFDDVHAVDGRCPLRLEILLGSGLVVTGPAPVTLPMDEPIVVNQ
jgi:2-polyprenyl-3-methyl-5-hydroxy-6-metoxy-1,4-benzoquinol methylase